MFIHLVKISMCSFIRIWSYCFTRPYCGGSSPRNLYINWTCLLQLIYPTMSHLYPIHLTKIAVHLISLHKGLELWCLTPPYIMEVSFTGVGNRLPGENHPPTASHWQTLSHTVLSRIPRLSGIRTHNINGDRHWLHK